MIFQVKHFSLSALALGSTLILTGCNSVMNPHDKPSQPQITGSIGLANPASTYCINKGGKLVIAKDKEGNEFGVCHLPDGTQIEEWALFRRDNPSAQ